MLTHERHEFYDFVAAQWGPDRAGQLMDLLPPDSNDQLVTRNDLAVATAQVRTGLAELRTEVKTEIAELRTETHALMREQTRTILLAQIGLWVTTMLAIVGALARG